MITSEQILRSNEIPVLVATPEAVQNIWRDLYRNIILNFEKELGSIEGAVFGDNVMCPLTHRFSEGIYMREILIPAGTALTGKIHKWDHPLFLMDGEVSIFTEEGAERIKAPYNCISKGGVKRLLFAHTNCIFTTLHHNPTNTQDLEILEDFIIAKSYEELQVFQDKNLQLEGGTE